MILQFCLDIEIFYMSFPVHQFLFCLKIIGQFECVSTFLILIHHFVLLLFIVWFVKFCRLEEHNRGIKPSSYLKLVFTRNGLESSHLNLNLDYLSSTVSSIINTSLGWSPKFLRFPAMRVCRYCYVPLWNLQRLSKEFCFVFYCKTQAIPILQ